MSDKPGFTEGPWRFARVGGDIEGLPKLFSVHAVDKDDKGRRRTRLICDVYERENARRIAALPKLLEALEAISEAADHPFFNDEDEQMCVVPLELLVNAVDALAKARGE